MLLAQIIVYIFLIYLAIGVFFAVYFAFFAVKNFDDAAKRAGIGFRLIIFIGAIPFWTFLLMRILRGGGRPAEVNSHRKIAEEIKK